MLAGRPPFTGATLPALAHAVLYDTPPVLDRLAGDRRRPTACCTARWRRRRTSAIRRPRRSPPICASALPLVDERSGRGGAADPAPGRAAVPSAQARSRHRLSRAQPGRRAGQLADRASSRWSCARRSSRRATPARRPISTRIAADLAVDVVLTGSILRAQGQRARQRRAGRRCPPATSGGRTTPMRRSTRVLDLHDELARRVLASLPLSGRRSTGRRAAAPATTKAFDLYLRGMQLRAEAGALAPGARVLRAVPRARSRRSRRPGPSADGSSACSASTRTPRSWRRPRRRSAARWSSIPTTAPRSTTTRSSRSTSAGVDASLARLLERGAAAARRAARLRRAGPRLPLRRTARRIGGRAPRRPSRLDPTRADQRAAHLLHAGRL